METAQALAAHAQLGDGGNEHVRKRHLPVVPEFVHGVPAARADASGVGLLLPRRRQGGRVLQTKPLPFRTLSIDERNA